MSTYASAASSTLAPTLSTAYVDHVDSPAGPLAFAVDAAGALVGISFLDGRYAHSLEEELGGEGYRIAADPDRTAAVRAALVAYAAGERQDLDLPVALRGSDWQIAVWRALQTIPFGETRTYGQIAEQLGRPGSARAVGRANATNRIPLVVPCHRVIGANGSLTGFAGGTHLKTRLLDHEARVAGRQLL